MKTKANRMALTTFASIAALGLFTSGARAASVRLTGGGTAGESLQVEIMEDIIISTNSGSSFGGYFFGFHIAGALTTYDNYFSYNIATTASTPFEYQSGSGQPTLSLNEVGASTSGGILSVYFSGAGYPEVLIGEGGSITMKAGTVTRLSQSGNNVLANSGQIYDLPISAFYSDTEAYQSLSPSTASVTSVPEASSALIAAIGVGGAAFVRRRKMVG